MSHSKIFIRALPNVEFVHGYPGIPPGPGRPQASVKGTIEVRLGGQPVKTKWVKVGLRKVESTPNGSNGEEFIDFAGQSPVVVWRAQGEDDALTSMDFPFDIRIPETMPPSVALRRGAGIKVINTTLNKRELKDPRQYEIVATLCMKEKKGLLRREASTTLAHSVPVVIDKHELHSTWPIYAQPESHQVTYDRLTLIVNRAHTCFAPGDRMAVMATLKSDNLSPVVLRGFEYSLKEKITYRSGPHSNSKKAGPQVHVATLGEQKVPVATTLYGGTLHKAELGCIVPNSHTTSSVNTGRHIDILYTMNVKAILDKTKPIVLDLPVTITNWPRNVSADMVRRIGTAPNLSRTPPGTHGAPTQAVEVRQGVAPLRPSPDIGLRSLDRPLTSPGTITSGSPGSTDAGRIPSDGSMYSRHFGASKQVSIGTARMFYDVQENVQEQSRKLGNEYLTSSTNSGPVTEFGYRREANTFAGASQHMQHGDSGGDADVSQRSSVGNGPLSTAPIRGSDSESRELKTDPDNRRVVLTSTSSIRPPNRTLQIVNATDDIQDADSPINDPTVSLPQGEPQSDSLPVARRSPPQPSWPAAEEEKQRLFDTAKAQVERVQSQIRVTAAPSGPARSVSLPYSNTRSTLHSNGHLATPERHRSTSPSLPKSSWPTPEDEKRRLYEQAQSNVQRTQRMLTQSDGPTNNPIPHVAHHRTASADTSQDTSRRYRINSPTPTISAGAALYSHAIASMKSSAMSPSIPRQASLSSIPTKTMTSSSEISSTRQYPSIEEEKSAIRYQEARSAVTRHLKRQKQEVVHEDPISYDALFPPGGVHAASSVEDHFGGAPVASGRPITPQDPQTATSNATQIVSDMPSPARGASDEKEIMRKAFEARDAALIRSGQAPPSTEVSEPNPQPPAQNDRSSYNQRDTPLSEKEQAKIAFERRDRILATQQVPENGIPLAPSPPPPPLASSTVPRFSSANVAGSSSAQTMQEKDVGPSLKTDLSRGASLRFNSEHPSSPTEGSQTSGSSEVYLRRDPTISAGKQRASQMITTASPPVPPPLLPRPPAEYIEETRREDMRNLLSNMRLTGGNPTSLDSGFNLYGNEDGVGSYNVVRST